MKSNLTNLNFAILGLLLEKSLSGYQIRKIFESSAMGIFSDSPGSIYPALKKLIKKGYIIQSKKGSKKIISISESGKEELKKWVLQPLKPDDVSKKMEVQLLKYVFSESLISKSQKNKFLATLSVALDSYLENLNSFLKKESDRMTKHGKHAFQLGISTTQLQLHWVKKTIQNLDKITV